MFDLYTPPSDAIFNTIKEASIALWKTYDDTYGYATEKVDRIKDIKNVGDNASYMVAMFDHHNQAKLINSITDEDALSYMEDLYEYAKISY